MGTPPPNTSPPLGPPLGPPPGPSVHTRHIGIAAVSHVGAGFFYQQLLQHATNLLPAGAQPKVTLHNEPLADYINAAEKHDWEAVADLLRRSAEILHSAGAEICVTPDNAVQFSLQMAETGSPIPWISMTETATRVIEEHQRSIVGLLGTNWVTGGSVYQTALGMKGIKAMAPARADADRLHSIILGELVHGNISASSRADLNGIIARLCDRGADSMLLCSSEAQIAIDSAMCPVPVYDTVDILAEHIIRWALIPTVPPTTPTGGTPTRLART